MRATCLLSDRSRNLPAYRRLTGEEALRAALAESWHCDGFYLTAAEAWEELYRRLPSPDVAMKVATAWASLGEIRETSRWLREADRAGVAREELHYTTGLVRWRTGDTRGAATELRRAAEADRRRARALNALGVIVKRAGRTAEAHELWQEALTREPLHAQASLNLLRTTHPVAIDNLSAIATANPEQSATFAVAAQVFAKLGKTDLAAAARQRLALRRPAAPVPLSLPKPRRAHGTATARGHLSSHGCRLEVSLPVRVASSVALNPGWSVWRAQRQITRVTHAPLYTERPVLGAVDLYELSEGGSGEEVSFELVGCPVGPGTHVDSDRIELDGRSAWLPLAIGHQPINWVVDVAVPDSLRSVLANMNASEDGPSLLALPPGSWIETANQRPQAYDLARASARRWLRHGTAFWSALLGRAGDSPIGVVQADRSTFCYTRSAYVRITTGLLARPDQWSQLSHEAGHLWWGNHVRFAPADEWWNEALAEYIFHRIGSERVRARYREEALAACLSEPLRRYARFGLARLGREENRTAAFVLRTKGGFVVSMLERVMGSDAFERFLADLVEVGQHYSLRTYDVAAIAGCIHGASLAWFINQWIHTECLPTVQVKYTRRQQGDLAWGVDLTALTTDTSVTFGIPIKIEVRGPTGEKQEALLPLDAGHAQCHLQVGFRPASVHCDPDSQLWTRSQVTQEEA